MTFIVRYKWWLAACSPFIIVIIVLKLLSPR